jgi:hypothetical protein
MNPDVPLSVTALFFREFYDSFPLSALSEMSPRDSIKSTCKTDCRRTSTIALARLLAAKPHSSDVELLISSCSQLKTSE